MSVDQTLSEGFSLKELQGYAQAKAVERGFNLTDPSKKLVMLIEEVGELAKAIRKTAGLKFTNTTERKDIAEELADVQIVLIGLAEMLKIDMSTAVRTKEEKNNKRTWSKLDEATTS